MEVKSSDRFHLVNWGQSCFNLDDSVVTQMGICQNVGQISFGRLIADSKEKVHLVKMGFNQLDRLDISFKGLDIFENVKKNI